MRSRFFLMAVFVCAIVIGCAGTAVSPPAARWRCDAEADAAVAQGDWQQAREAHEHLVQREPDNGLALYHLGYIVGKNGDRQREIAYYHKAIAAGYDRDDQLFFNLGMALGGMNPDASLDAFERAISLDPDNAENHFGLALMAEAQGQSDRAAQALKQAIAIQPDHLDALLLLARIDLDLGRWADAAHLLDRVLKLDRDNEEAEELLKVLDFRKRIQYEALEAGESAN